MTQVKCNYLEIRGLNLEIIYRLTQGGAKEGVSSELPQWGVSDSQSSGRRSGVRRQRTMLVYKLFLKNVQFSTELQYSRLTL